MFKWDNWDYRNYPDLQQGGKYSFFVGSLILKGRNRAPLEVWDLEASSKRHSWGCPAPLGNKPHMADQDAGSGNSQRKYQPKGVQDRLAHPCRAQQCARRTPTETPRARTSQIQSGKGHSETRLVRDRGQLWGRTNINQQPNQPTSQPAHQPTSRLGQLAKQPTSQPSKQLPNHQPTSHPSHSLINQQATQPSTQPANQQLHMSHPDPNSQLCFWHVARSTWA